MPFQTSVGVQPAIGVPGDFANTNPRFVVPSGPGGFVAGAAGVTIGRFAWSVASFIDQDNQATILNSFGQGPVAGFIARAQQANITIYLADSGMVISSGQPAIAFSGGDFLIKNEGATYAQAGQSVYANLLTGAASFAAAGAPATASGSTSTVAAGASTFTGSIIGNVLTVSAVAGGVIYPGTTVSGTGVAVTTQILTQLSGTAGGIGTYSVTIGEQAVASTAITGAYGLLTVAGTVAGVWTVGGLLAGAGVAAGTYITAPITGVGGAGTYVVNNATVVSSAALTATTNVQTKWIAVSAGAAGETIKITDHQLG